MPARANASRAVVRAKHARLREPHVAPLVVLADQIAAARGLAPGEVPYPDPEFTGIAARALVLLESPGPKTDRQGGSGLLSLENDDPTAERAHVEYARAGLDWRELLHWNVVPWPSAANQKLKVADHEAANPWLVRLTELLPEIQAVMLLGRTAERGWARAHHLLPSHVRSLPTIVGPHPSKRGMYRPGAEQRLRDAIAELASLLR